MMTAYTHQGIFTVEMMTTYTHQGIMTVEISTTQTHQDIMPASHIRGSRPLKGDDNVHIYGHHDCVTNIMAKSPHFSHSQARPTYTLRATRPLKHDDDVQA